MGIEVTQLLLGSAKQGAESGTEVVVNLGGEVGDPIVQPDLPPCGDRSEPLDRFGRRSEFGLGTGCSRRVGDPGGVTQQLDSSGTSAPTAIPRVSYWFRTACRSWSTRRRCSATQRLTTPSDILTEHNGLGSTQLISARPRLVVRSPIAWPS